MKFNMGCGRRKLEGWVNVDSWAGCEPDVLWDLERTPWPWDDGCATTVLFNHSLEHLGGDPKVFLAIIREIYRLVAPGAAVGINVPHPYHDTFLGDPTHVRPITPLVLSLFDWSLNDQWAAARSAATPLAHHLEVDLEVVKTIWILDDAYKSQVESGALSRDQLSRLARERMNVVKEWQFTLVAHKPIRRIAHQSASA